MSLETTKCKQMQQDEKQWAQNETREAPSEHQETFYHCKGDQALAQVSQRGCGVSLVGDAKKLSGHVPRQPVLGGPCLSSGVGPDDVQRSLSTSAIL